MDAIRAIVQKVMTDGKHGPYAIAINDDLKGSVTFSLEPTVWREKDWPEPGNVVYLSSIIQKRAGWRAKEGRFWKPSDEQLQQRAKSSEHVTFLYPTSRQFPFDEVCETIVRKAEEKHWNIPGFRFEFSEYGTGESKFKHLYKIYGPNFMIEFCRIQGYLGGNFNDVAAVRKISIPKMEINVFKDESGPRLFVYIGKNWKADKDWFMNGNKIHSKLDNKQRLYLVYTGGCEKQTSSSTQHTYMGTRSAYLVNYNDLGREYSAEGKEPLYYETDKIFYQFTIWLEDNVLKPIWQAETNGEKMLISAATIPWPEKIGPIFTFGDWHDAKRIGQGKLDKNKLEPQDRYGLLGGGTTFVSWDASNDGTVPEVAYNNFLFCGLGPVDEKSESKSLHIPGGLISSNAGNFIIRVTPKSANQIYIADIAVREEYRTKWFKDNADQRRLSNDAYREFQLSSGRTMIPIVDYEGNYKAPVVLIKRELSFDEVEIVREPFKH